VQRQRHISSTVLSASVCKLDFVTQRQISAYHSPFHHIQQVRLPAPLSPPPAKKEAVYCIGMLRENWNDVEWFCYTNVGKVAYFPVQ
jgi:hypothetical protein